jgi:hypothetical protein
MGWFSKDKEKKPVAETPAVVKEEGSMMEFQDVLEKSLTEDRPDTDPDKRQSVRAKAMVKMLLDHNYSIDEINDFIKSGRRYELKKGEVIEK